ncbi:L protein [Maldonado virus]|uniref:RNA-directed RNA polymerase L n=1 Tax=Maldonado virus TaxID=1004889 RepID=F2W3Q8_9VIRU|nr:L protein [Maldonado virus]AEA30055.1 L protein [Maldonado virus]
MEEILNKQQIPEGIGLFRPDIKQYDDSIMDVEIPFFHISKCDGYMKIDLDLNNGVDYSTIGSSLISTIEVPDKSLPNLVHDVVFSHLASNTDVRFSTIFGVYSDSYDHLSPDLILKTAAGSHHVVEFTTNRGGERGAFQACKDKFSKYHIPCENRAVGSRVSLFVISVYVRGVWSNLDLTDDEVNELVFRFRLAIAIMEEAKRYYPELTEDESEMTKQEREILGVISSIQMNWEVTSSRFPHFKEKLFEDFMTSSADEEYLSTIISEELTACQEDMIKSGFIGKVSGIEEKLNLNEAECATMIGDYLKSRSNECRDKLDSKSTVQIPPWTMTDFIEGKSVSCLSGFEVEGDHPMCKIWRSVTIAAAMGDIDRADDDPNAELQKALEGSIQKSDERSRYHRIKLNLTNEEIVYGATLGVEGKSHKNNAQVEESRKRSKLGFSLDHDITNLEEFINKHDLGLFEESDDYFNPFQIDFDLRESAQKIHQPDLIINQGENEFLANHKRLCMSKLGSWCQMVSLIGAELSASVKQHVGKGQFVIKRILNSPLFMLIKPTSSVSHIFVSFALVKSNHMGDLWENGVFKHYIDAGDLFVTDFISYKLSKLTNLCKCFPLMESAICFWTEIFGFEPWNSTHIMSTDRSGSSKEAASMIKLTLLTLMEDKAVTEEIQTIQRYIIMEGFVSLPELPKPHKMLSKLPAVLRSELQVYLVLRSLRTMERISKNPFHLQKKHSQITWSGLFNPLTGNTLRDLQPLISICYNGYFKNKEEETEPSALSRLYKKIIELEHLCPKDDKFLGSGDPREPKMHEFSRSFLKKCTDHGKTILRKIYGQNFMQQVDTQIMREIGSITLEKLATLKASSNFDERWYDYSVCSKEDYHREKAIVKMSEFAASGKTLAIEVFDECMKLVENRGNMHICLFKKQQHGGDREIYVLGREERIIQSIVEAISRSIGRFFPSDTLCNPGNKIRIPETHGIRARKHCRGAVWTCSTSDDARKWNQGHFVTKFALMLCEFTLPKWWPIIIRGCSMFTNKFMMMNMRYISILSRHKELEVEDEFSRTIFRAFHGEVRVPWMEEGSTYLKTKTGMMQGILHFTSSLLHTLHQEFIRSLSFKIFNTKVRPEMSQSIVIDMMQGSDDSSMMISFPCSNEDELMKCKIAAAICFRMKKRLGVYLAIYPSEKSTSNTDFVMEYNSEFFFHSQHVRPTVRWVAACCNLPEVETLVARQEEASNLMTSVSEGGGSFSLAACIQQAQCTLHYMLMGMGISSLFEEYKKAIIRWKDPGLGFFLLDNPYCAGLGGFRFNLYKAISQTPLKCLYSYFMKKVRQGIETNDGAIPESCSVSPGGAIVLSSALRWGSKQKFYKLRDKLNIPEDWVDQINQNPSVLYRAPRSGEEVVLRIAEKVHSPGVVSSLSTGNAVAKVIASSVYFLSAAIFQDSGRQEFSILDSSKYSLLQKLSKLEGINFTNAISDEDLLFLFPNIEDLQSLDGLVYNRGPIEIVRRKQIKENTQSKVIVFEGNRNLRTPAEYLISDKWFGTQKSKIGRTAFDQEWEKVTSIIPWLRDSPQETLSSSPLDNHIQIRNFFSRMDQKPRIVRVTGAPIKKRSGVSKLSMVIRDNFSKLGFIKDIEDITGTSRTNSAEMLKHFMFCALQGPYSQERKLQMVMDLLGKSNPIGVKDSDGKSRSNILAILQSYVYGEPHIARQIEDAGAGIIGGFVVPQKPKKLENTIYYYGYGVWRGVMDGKQVQIELDNAVGSPPMIISVTMEESAEPWQICKSIRSWADDVGAKNNLDISSKIKKKTCKYWMFDFKTFSSDKAYGAPVYMTKKKMVDFRLIDDSEINIKVRKSTVNLYVKNDGRDVHILSYSASDSDLSPASLRISDESKDEMMDLFNKEPSKSWATCSPIPAIMMHKIIKVVQGELRITSLDSERLGEIMKLCCESSLRSRIGTLFSALPSVQNTSRVDVDDLIDIVLTDSKTTGFKEIVKSLENDIKNEYEMEDFDLSDIDLFGPAHYKELSDLNTISHPLMDDYVEFCISTIGRKELRRILETNRCKTKDLQLSKDLFLVLGRNPNDIKVDEYNIGEQLAVEDDMIG